MHIYYCKTEDLNRKIILYTGGGEGTLLQQMSNLIACLINGKETRNQKVGGIYHL